MRRRDAVTRPTTKSAGGAPRVKPASPKAGAATKSAAVKAPAGGAAPGGMVLGEAENAAVEAEKMAAVASGSNARARTMKKSASAAKELAAVESSAMGPRTRPSPGGKAAQVGDMESAPAGEFDRAGFIAAVEARVNAQAPRTLEEADGFEKSGALEDVKQSVKETASGKKEAVTSSVDSATEQAPDPSRGSRKPGGALAANRRRGNRRRSTLPARCRARSPPRPPTCRSRSENPISRWHRRTSARSNSRNSNEPAFLGALNDKKAGEQHSKTAPGPVRAAERSILGSAKAGAKTDESAALGGMFSSRQQANQQVGSDKQGSKSANEAERAAVAQQIESIYTSTQAETKAVLDGIDPQVDTAFETGEAAARKAFENAYKTDLDRFKNRRYSGILGKGRWLKDKLTSPPAEVGRIIAAARKLYLSEMRKVVGKIADIVGRELTRAKQRVAAGRVKITEYVESLPKKLQKQGAELAKGVQAKLDTLDQDVDSKKDAMIDKVANRYRDSKAAVDARVEEMKAENMGLWDRAKAAIAGVIQTIIELKNALASALRKASNAIVGIIKDPIGFLNNLIQAFKHGLEMYLGRIKTHLLGGVIKWLTGAMGDLDIKVPAKFDLRGIVDLVLQVLGITWDNIRAQIVRRLGPAGAKVIGRVEQGVGLIAKMLSEGPIALWSLIVGRVTGLWDMVVGKIQSFIEDTIIMQGIQWLMGLINPAAAFVKACKMIIDGVMWLWNNAKRIVQLIDTIAGSAFSIAKGAIGTAAGAIERVLGRLTPILISFLASLLGLNGAVSRVKEIISAVRKPVTRVIGKVVDKGVQFGRKLLKTPLGKKVAGGLKKAKAWGKKQVDTAKRLGDRAVQKVKKRVYGGDDTFEGRQERLRLAMTSAVRAVNAYAGKKVRRLTLDPQLKAIKLRRGIGYLDVVPVGEFWHVEGRVDRSMATDARNDGSTTGDSPEQGPLSGHAQRGGQVIVGLTGPYSRIGSGKVKDDRDFKGANGSAPDYLRVIAEHVLPRQAVDRIARAMGFVGAPRGGKWDRAAETVLIYKGAADMKTTELDPDTEKDTRAIAATMRNRESTPQQRSSAHQDLRRLLERHTQGSIANTAYVVAQEDRKHRPQRGNNDILPSSGTISAVGMAELDQATLHIVGGAELDRDATGVSETESPLAAARALAVATGEDDRINKPGEVTELGPNRVEVKYYGSPRLVIDFRVKGRGITWRIRTSADKTRLDSGKVGAGTRGHVLGRIAQERAKAAAASTNDPKLETATLAEINSWDSVGLQQLRGVGPKIAHEILACRAQLGGRFDTVDQVERVKGVGPVIKGRITG